MEHYKMIFCCSMMEQEALELRLDQKTKNHTIIYDQSWREYAIKFIFHDRGEDMCRDIQYCPWCGSKLPNSLADVWFDTLSSEYNIQDPSDADRKKVPLEFKTDEWWIKRGL